MHLRGLFVTLCLASAAFGQDANCPAKEVLVTMRSEIGNVTKDISPRSFRAKFHGKPMPITSVSALLGRQRALLLLDGSGSMKTEYDQNWPMVLSVAERLVVSAPDNTELAFIMFQERVVIESTSQQVGT